MFEEVAVDPLVDRSRDPVRIDEQHGDSRPARRFASLEASGRDTAMDGAAAEVAATEPMRNWRLFIGARPRLA